MAKGGKDYVDNSELLREIVLSLERKELTPRALEMLLMIVRRANGRLTYKYAEDKEDCIAFAQMEVLRYWDRFKPERSSNPFAYYTQIAKNGYAKGWEAIYPKRYKGTVSLTGGKTTKGGEANDGIFTV